MVTVKQFKEAGLKFVSHDVINYKSGKLWDELNVLSKEQMQDLYMYADDLVVESLAWRKNTWVMPVSSDCWVESLAWRKNTGVMPVSSDCWVELKTKGCPIIARARDVKWHDRDYIISWKPYLQSLEQQMTDNQETKTALEMSERDIENYSDTRCVFEWSNGDECVYENDKETIYTYVGIHPHGDGHYIFNDEKGITYVENGYIHEPETPEEKAGRELWGVKSDCSNFKHYSWSELSKESKDEWIEFAKRLGFTTGI